MESELGWQQDGDNADLFRSRDKSVIDGEAVVNLEQIQQRMSMKTETVGGPIDVAVISKHDGFVWIKRKHYFDINLNPSFVETYFK